MTTVSEEDKAFYEQMAFGDDVSVVIKAAVKIDREIAETLNHFFYDPKILETLDLTYFQRVGLLVASGFQDRFHTPLKALGKIRNRFAHQPINELSKSDVNNFYNSFSEDDKSIIQETYKIVAKSREKKEKFSSLSARDKFTLCVITLRAPIIKARQEAMTD